MTAPTSSSTDTQDDAAFLRSELQATRWMLDLATSLNETRSEQGIRSRLKRLMAQVEGSTGADLHVPPAWHGSPDHPDHSFTSALERCGASSSLVWQPSDTTPDDTSGTLFVPVVGPTGLLAILSWGWRRRPDLEDPSQTARFAAIARHVAASLERAQLLERRTGIAMGLQSAMLTPLPRVPGLELAACYVPASDDEWVGGDWYDAVVLPADDRHDLRVAVTVGDVMGHDLPAAAMMGQARALLRQAAQQHADHGPALMFERFEETCTELGVAASGSAVLACLERSRTTGGWSLRWTSAGHPPPIVVDAHGTVRRLELTAEAQGMLFGYRDVFDGARVESHLALQPGATVLFYSDGVIEMPGLTLESQMDELGDVLESEHHRGPQAVVDSISMNFGTGYDDIVALAVRLPADA
ncbi:PP2C family protein-serine/threonine phosphatase [Nocardioides sp.]|uniref:PP2C family protein-serine/threonine phosphatase n=1 Tax=Nocardioides sp. TaxID=35761 RepID=UPI003564ED19